MRNNLRTSVVAAVATVCVAMSAGTALADCATPWSPPMTSTDGAAVGAGTANDDLVAYNGPSGNAVLGHHNIAGAGAARW